MWWVIKEGRLIERGSVLMVLCCSRRFIRLRVAMLLSSLVACWSLPIVADDFAYKEARDRFSFAQLYLGSALHLDDVRVRSGFSSLDSDFSAAPKGVAVTIGALHFWGRADFYVTFSQTSDIGGDGSRFEYSPGVETGGRWYINRVRDGGVSPWLGAGFSFSSISGSKVGDSNKFVVPMSAGLTFASEPFLFDVYAKYTSDGDHVLWREEAGRVPFEVGPVSYGLGVRFVKDLSIHGRKKSSADLPKGVHLYVGGGPSSSWLTSSDVGFPRNGSISQKPAIFPELSVGAEWKFASAKGVRSIFNMSYRNQVLEDEAFLSKQEFRNEAMSIELMQSFGDYNGFVPFLGLSLTRSNMSYKIEMVDSVAKYSDSKSHLGYVFGWDILPNHTDKLFLRTILRYYPNIKMRSESRYIRFPNFEFNFIQAVYRF